MTERISKQSARSIAGRSKNCALLCATQTSILSVWEAEAADTQVKSAAEAHRKGERTNTCTHTHTVTQAHHCHWLLNEMPHVNPHTKDNIQKGRMSCTFKCARVSVCFESVCVRARPKLRGQFLINQCQCWVCLEQTDAAAHVDLPPLLTFRPGCLFCMKRLQSSALCKWNN